MDPTQLLQKALQTLGADVPTAQNLMRIAVQLAQEVNKATELTGRAKLDRVLQALRDLLALQAVTDRVPPAQVAALRSVVDDVIPETISLVVEASRGAFQLKKPSVGCIAHWGALLCRIAAAHGPAQFQEHAAQAAQMAAQLEKNSEKDPNAAVTVAIELVQLEVQRMAEQGVQKVVQEAEQGVQKVVQEAEQEAQKVVQEVQSAVVAALQEKTTDSSEIPADSSAAPAASPNPSS